MSKKVIAILLCSLLIISMGISGCGSGAKDSSTSTEPAKTEPAKTEAAKTEPAKVEAPAGDEVLSSGPYGEKAVSATTLKLTDEEIAKVKAGNYKAAISLHYGGNDWSTSQVQGLTDTFNKLGIKIVATTDANYKSEKQVSDIENILSLKPDVIVSIPVENVATVPGYQKAVAAGVKMVFMDFIPNGFKPGKDYVTVVSADNYGNGFASGTIMGKKLNGKGKVGILYLDADVLIVKQREQGFVDALKQKYPDIQIVGREGFTDPNKVSEVANAMLTKYPDMNGMFAPWDLPGEGAAAAARTAGRNDMVITTIDLGTNAAREIAADGLIKGLGAQKPYEQGVAEAMAAAYSLLGKDTAPFYAVPALPVDKDNVLDAFKIIYHKDPPDTIVKAAKK